MDNDVLKAFDGLIKTHETVALVRKYKPDLKVAFDAERIKDDAFAASYPNRQTDGACAEEGVVIGCRERAPAGTRHVKGCEQEC